MNINLRKITVRDLVEGYADDGAGGVRGLGGKLDIRPPYQREFIYKDKQRNAVIESIRGDFPLNTMYWAEREDGTYEVIDGQQRTISIAQFVAGDFAIVDGGNKRYFRNLDNDEKAQILDYELLIYVCAGSDGEKLKWFQTINIAGEKLTDQELRNAVYAGPWVSDAKRYFSRRGCAAYGIGQDFVKGAPIRQDYLETAITWISGGKSEISGYMADHQHDKSAVELWNFYRSVIDWAKAMFPTARKEMKGVDWGSLYREFGGERLDPAELETEVARLMMDDDVSKKAGIYPYLLTRDEKYLNIRAFTPAMKAKVYEKQGGICPTCPAGSARFELKAMEADHITPWSEGGKTTEDNCQMLCRECNRRKGNR